MPVAEFAGRFGWGYDGVDLFAPSRLYGTPDDARHFIDAAHRLGLARHSRRRLQPLRPGRQLPARLQRRRSSAQPGEWGDSINYDGPARGPVRAFVIENAAYWIDEFHFDGLRFDATQGIHDSSPEHIIAEMCARGARRRRGSRTIFLVGENEPQDARPAAATAARIRDGLDAIWNEDWHHAASWR